MSHSQGLWYVSKERAEIRPLDVPSPREGEVLVRALFSGISRGTERLVFRGRVPPSEHERMRCPHQEGNFPFPVKYGYALVAVVEDGPSDVLGRTVFLLHPHQRHACIPTRDIHPVPLAIPAQRGALAANAEAALNIVWDAGPMPGDRILVVGGGVLGLLVTAIATRIPGVEVTVVDPVVSREAVASGLGAHFAPPAGAPGEQDIVVHASGREEGLRLALECAGTEATVVEASWYGDGQIRLPLGGAFHSRRLSLISSQVGAVPAHRRARWSTHRRLRTALELLRDDRLDALIAEIIAFDQAPERLPDILAEDSTSLMTVLSYT